MNRLCAALASCLLLASTAATIDASSRQAGRDKAMTVEERSETARRFLESATLRRSDLRSALSEGGAGLPPDLAETVLETVYPLYVREIGAATQEAIDRLYPVDGNGAASMPRLDAGQLVAIARTLADGFRAATDAAASEAARSSATPNRPAETIAAELLRRLAARDFQVVMTGFHDPGSPGYDTWLDFAAARREHADIAAAADRADKDQHARASLDAALSAFRAEGFALGSALVDRSGATAVATRVFWDGPDAQPAELARIVEASRALGPRWLEANERLGAAIERHLALGVGPDGADRHAPARWRLRHLVATASQSTPSYSAADATADAAVALGVCADEVAAIQAELDASLADRVARRSATVAAHRAWLAEAAKAGTNPTRLEPSAELVAAYERQLAAESAARRRILAAIRSPIVADALRGLPEPTEGPLRPMWLRTFQRPPQADEEGQP